MKQFVVLVAAMVMAFGFISNAGATTSMLIAAVGTTTDYTAIPAVVTIDDIESLQNMILASHIVLDWHGTSVTIQLLQVFDDDDGIELIAATADSAVLNTFADSLMKTIVKSRREHRRYEWEDMSLPELGGMRGDHNGIVSIPMERVSGEFPGTSQMVSWISGNGFSVRGIAIHFKSLPAWAMKGAPFHEQTFEGGPDAMYRGILAAGKPPIESWYRFWVAPNSPANPNPSGYIHVLDVDGTSHLSLVFLKGLSINQGEGLMDRVEASGWSHLEMYVGSGVNNGSPIQYLFQRFTSSTGSTDTVFAGLRDKGVLIGAPVEKPDWAPNL